MDKTQSVFKNRNYLLLFQGTLTSNVAASLYSFALSFYILELTNNNAFIQGLYLAMCGIVFVIMSFFGGILADRWNKVKIIYFSDFIKGLTILLCMIPIYLFINEGNNTGQIVILFIIGFIANVISAIFSPTSTAIIPEIVEENQLQQANSYFSVLASFISILGVLLAGIFYSLLSILYFFLIVGICYILSGISELFIKTKYSNEKSEKLTLKLMIADFKDGLAYLWPMKGYVYLIFGVLFINFFFTPFEGNFIPYFIKTQIAGSNYIFSDVIKPEFWASIFSIMFGIGSIVAGIIFGSKKQKDKISRGLKTWLCMMTIGFCIMTLVYYLTIKDNINSFIIFLSLYMLFIGVCIIGINIPVSTILQRDIDKTKLAKVLSISSIGCQGLIPLASLIGGIILSTGGSGILLIFCSIGCLLTTIFIVFSKKVSEL